MDMGAWRVCASMLGPVRWVSASTWKRARHERESKMEGERGDGGERRGGGGARGKGCAERVKGGGRGMECDGEAEVCVCWAEGFYC